VVIVTPHVMQIRSELSLAFDDWYFRKSGKHARIVWNTPGGTSEILKSLQAQYSAAIKNGDIKPDGTCKPGVIPIDLALGGGSYDHGRIKKGVTVKMADGKDVTLSMSVPAGFTKETLESWFGENKIGAQNLYDPEQYWIGTALSSFGIVFNRDTCRSLHVPEPTSFEDLCRPELYGMVALADPRQSGSVATTLDAILSAYGWDRGWQVLREMSANTRYFTNSSTKPPIDVGAGEAAMGLAIDFYGRNQAESVSLPGQDPATARVGFCDPKGTVYIDADPVSLLRGGPNPALARSFIEFALSLQGQALWNFPNAHDSRAAANPKDDSGSPLGPQESNLRRLPVRREIYTKYWDQLTDKVNPYQLASTNKSKGWRDAIAPMMAAFAIDTATEQRAAWAAIIKAGSDTTFPPDVLAAMRKAFLSWPTHTFPDGSTAAFSETSLKSIVDSWKDAQKKNPGQMTRWQIGYVEYYRQTSGQIVKLADSRQIR
jgi:ABC-type Fe3+ transport system substrate-binding protein